MADESLVGQKFGRWLVLEKLEPEGRKKYRYLCRCDCGTERPVTRALLKYGGSKSCGCSKHSENLAGRKFGRLEVLERVSGLGMPRYFCHCDCGNEKIIRGNSLLSGNTNSCNCLRKEIILANSTKHGRSDSPEYRTWSTMKSRCYNKNNKSYYGYGALGITVCDEWRDNFQQFYDDMGPRPSSKHSIDRIDNSKGYSKENCRWATIDQQANNRSNNIVLIYNEKTQNLAQFAREYGISSKTLRKRLFVQKLSLEKALTQPVRKYGKTRKPLSPKPLLEAA